MAEFVAERLILIQGALVCVAIIISATLWASQFALGVLPPTASISLAMSPSRMAVTAPEPTWFERRPRGAKATLSNLQGLADITQWPREPASPQQVDDDAFREALGTLCPRAYRKTGEYMGPIVRKWSKHFGVDPFTLGALMYWRSNCRAKFTDGVRHGVAALNHAMHARQLQNGTYHYHVLDKSEWRPETLSVGNFGYWPGNLRRLEPSIYFAAAFLRVATIECRDLDKATGSIPHRHAVSHLYWGDRVRGTDMEDRVLAARRRLLGAYGVWDEPTRTWGTLKIQSPLGGAPRKITSDVGDIRDGGRRRHKGVDFASDRGEPVYAIADGIVAVAGPQMKQGTTPSVTASEALKIPREQLAKGGLFIMIDHGEHKRSAYMHLDTYFVKRGDVVRRGQSIGTVGRSGLTGAHAHLHFELREHVSRAVRDRHLLPIPILGDLVISPRDTWRGRRLLRRAGKLKRKIVRN